MDSPIAVVPCIVCNPNVPKLLNRLNGICMLWPLGMMFELSSCLMCLVTTWNCLVRFWQYDSLKLGIVTCEIECHCECNSVPNCSL